MKRKKIAIVILHFGLRKDTIECLMSLARTKRSGYHLEIYLVDNHTGNRFNEKSLGNYKIKIHTIVNKKNLGFSVGVNQGVKAALADTCDYIFLLNNDIVLDPAFFVQLMPYFADKKVGIVSPTLTYFDDRGKIWCSDGHLNELFLFTTFPNMDKQLSDASLPSVKVSEYAATAVIIRSTVFAKSGFLEERYFRIGEDVEWCFRVRKAGFKILFVGLPLAAHKVSASTGVRGTNLLLPINAYFYARNFFMMLRDHRESLSVVAGVIGQTFVRLPFYVFFRMSSRASVRAYLQGYVDGMYYLCTGSIRPFERKLPSLQS